MTSIYHNPRCSKSRATLALLEQRNANLDVIFYLETPPDVDTLRSICDMLNCSIQDIIRTGETIYKETVASGESRTDDDWYRIVATNPILLERPIVIHNNAAAIGRPPENVLSLF